MAAVNVNRSKHPTLTANTADTINWQNGRPRRCEVTNRSSSDDIYIAETGVATVAGDDTTLLRPGESIELDDVSSLISSGNAPYSVERVA